MLTALRPSYVTADDTKPKSKSLGRGDMRPNLNRIPGKGISIQAWSSQELVLGTENLDILFRAATGVLETVQNPRL